MQFFRPMHAVKAMTFDLDDTLYNNDPVIRQADTTLTQFIHAHFPHASALSRAQWGDFRRAAIVKDGRLASDMGELRREVLSKALYADVSSGNTQYATLREAVEACFHCFYEARSDFALDDSVHDTLNVLSKRFPLIGITNGNVDSEKIGISPYFDVILHASMTRPMKPHKAMFDEAADKLDLPTRHILHVGDNLIKDVYGALNAGYQAAWFACNRPMILNNEPVRLLPHVALSTLRELTYLR
ncbi:HAD-IA family hydrolase [Alteromonas sp. A079]|uniref:HAD-IA family hydrolase n=1 Tax=Alteromonas sp. A079 TaxID=3410268 RepID=UPI003BA13404